VRCLVEPSGVVLEVTQGETILAAARRAGHEWPTACDGIAECTDCMIAIVEGELSPARPDERDALRWHRRAADERLACQAKVVTDVVVRRDDLR
jgi:ferredoxin, 2Fe-2S